MSNGLSSYFTSLGDRRWADWLNLAFSVFLFDCGLCGLWVVRTGESLHRRALQDWAERGGVLDAKIPRIAVTILLFRGACTRRCGGSLQILSRFVNGDSVTTMKLRFVRDMP